MHCWMKFADERPWPRLIAGWFCWLAVLTLTACATAQPSPMPASFDGERALQDVAYQVNLGPRTPGSRAHRALRAWLVERLSRAGWQVTEQSLLVAGHEVVNVVAQRGQGRPWLVLGAHYDSRLWADQDPDPARRRAAVPGANDGASGVAVLLELARTLPQDTPGTLWLVFFDAEDNGEIPGWEEWSLGARGFVHTLPAAPDAAVIVDMVGDADLNLYQERNSTPALVDSIWKQAADSGFEAVFIPRPKYRILDDHLPFLQAAIPAVDIIDFDYPYWHTTQDTVDKVSADSLRAVGQTLLDWLRNGAVRFTEQR